MRSEYFVLVLVLVLVLATALGPADRARFADNTSLDTLDSITSTSTASLSTSTMF